MSESCSGDERTRSVIEALDRRYGTLDWWAASTDEVMIGAILTQQTRWENVERALERLRDRHLLSIAAIDHAEPGAIEDAIRCTGFFRVKARRLRALARFVIGTYGSVVAMNGEETEELRHGLLGVSGIGEETADSILCYGFSRCSFVIDAYTRRLAACAGIEEPPGGYRHAFESVLPRDNFSYRQTHAHIVEYAKTHCSRRRCDECSIRNLRE
jgi:endonuclease-3 related protein